MDIDNGLKNVNKIFERDLKRICLWIKIVKFRCLR